ncbi:MAG: TA system VapC family ribonuclease toxin [Phycicoccus sp.]
MIVLDVNVFVNAARRAAPGHAVARRTLLSLLTGNEPVGILDETLTAVVRILTHPRIGEPRSISEATSFCEQARAAPSARRLVPPEAAWATFTQSVREFDLRANDVPDAWLAAVASTVKATLVTFDRGFQRFPALDVRLLSAVP